MAQIHPVVTCVVTLFGEPIEFGDAERVEQVFLEHGLRPGEIRALSRKVVPPSSLPPATDKTWVCGTSYLQPEQAPRRASWSTSLYFEGWMPGRDEIENGIEREPHVLEFRASGPVPAGEGDPAAAMNEFLARLRRGFAAEFEDTALDVAVQLHHPARYSPRLVCLDLDSTLITIETLDEFARAVGAEEEVAAVTAAAMRGELGFDDALRARLQRLAGLPLATMEEVAARAPLSPGVERLLPALRRSGCRVAVVSGGFAWFVEQISQRIDFSFDYICANEFVMRDGKLSGEVKGEIVNGEAKAAFVRGIMERERLAPEEVVAVGDGANDVEMLSVAGLGVGFRPRPVLRESVDCVLDHFGLDGLLYLFGMSDRDIDGEDGNESDDGACPSAEVCDDQ